MSDPKTCWLCNGDGRMCRVHHVNWSPSRPMCWDTRVEGECKSEPCPACTPDPDAEALAEALKLYVNEDACCCDGDHCDGCDYAMARKSLARWRERHPYKK